MQQAISYPPYNILVSIPLVGDAAWRSMGLVDLSSSRYRAYRPILINNPEI
jgi:hypothetical protein